MLAGMTQRGGGTHRYKEGKRVDGKAAEECAGEIGKYLYWLAARDSNEEHVTYIPTRFSNTQMNVTALAIFFAMARRLPHELGVLILDDPTQSMDTAHKEALAALLAEESENQQILVASEDKESRSMLMRGQGEKLTVLELATWSEEGARMLPGSAVAIEGRGCGAERRGYR
jgi:hypothetical protein